MNTCLTQIFLIIVIKAYVSNAGPQTVVPGVDWKDTSGNLIEAHGAGIIRVGNTYYWFGEDKSGNNKAWVNVYSSNDLVNWMFKNHALPIASSGELSKGKVVERPKVIYNSHTKKYVMHFHLDNSHYGEASVGVATSATVDGVYTYVQKFQPNGQQSRDMTTFQDTDGKAYVIYASNISTTINRPLRVSQLSDDYLTAKGEMFHFHEGDAREAPALVKFGHTYCLLTSTTSGWNPNPVKYSTASSISGPWTDWVNLVSGSGTTYRSQSAYIIPVVGSSTTSYIYAGDRWQGSHLVDSRYIWLPLSISGTKLSMSWDDYWTVDTLTGVITHSPPDSGTEYKSTALSNTKHGEAKSVKCGSSECIGYIGHGADNYLQFNGIHVSAAGKHTVRIYYANNDDNYRSADINVNGGAKFSHKFPPTDNQVRSIFFDVDLKAGNNTIKFSNQNAYVPDLNRLTIKNK